MVVVLVFGVEWQIGGGYWFYFCLTVHIIAEGVKRGVRLFGCGFVPGRRVFGFVSMGIIIVAI